MEASESADGSNARVFNIYGSNATINIGQSVTAAVPSQPPTRSRTVPKEKIFKLLKYKRNPTTRELRLVAENLGRYWKPLGEEMGFSWGQLDNIEEDKHS